MTVIFRLFGKKKPAAAADLNIDDILADMDARTGANMRAKELPAWALLLRSPYESYREPTSWLGGVPHVPSSFDWPRGKDGRALHFIAQIDLATLSPEPTTGARAPGLPTEGALLIFIGDGFAIRVLAARDMRSAAPAMLPPDLVELSEHGFWGHGPTFNRWAVDPLAYLSRGEERPDFLPDPFATPQQWITTWGLAAIEATVAHDALARELRLGREFMDNLRAQQAQGREPPSLDHIKRRIAHCALMEDHAPNMLLTLAEWRATAAARRAEDPVDVAALTAIFAERTKLSTAMKNNYGARTVLAGHARAVWERIMADAGGVREFKNFTAVAPAHRPLIEAWVTDWRNHRLFGIEPEFPNNFEDLRHQNPLISIGADALIGTQSEHDYGFSVWLKDEDIARGHHREGQFIRHCAV
jgi:hypothetical protein